jgi:hypothetical protein
MHKVYEINGCRISVRIDERSIHIDNDRQLWELLGQSAEDRTHTLIALVLEDFGQYNRRPLRVSADSLAVEIWGHVYVEYYSLHLHRRFRLRILKHLAGRIARYCEVIDCGEKGVDTNRRVWDLLATFKSRIAGWLPKDIAARGITPREKV